MEKLAHQKCIVCRSDSPQVTEKEMNTLLPQIPNWNVIEVEGIPRLQRTYKFKNFQTALDFTNRVGAEAEKEDHHPALLTEWGQVTVSWWTHSISGLHRNDLIMAAKTDQIAIEDFGI